MVCGYFVNKHLITLVIRAKAGIHFKPYRPL